MEGASTRTGGRVGLLAAQTLALGLASAFLIIPSSGLFLDAYGSRRLPWTYIAVAFAGAASTPVIARALRRWSLPAVSVAMLAGTAALIAGSWAVLAATDAAWPSALLLVLFPMAIQLGFVVISGQAGRLLHVRQMKALFPRIVAGFPVGFLVGGLAAPPVLSAFDGAEHVLTLAAGSTLAFLALVVATRTRFPSELAMASGDPGEERPPHVPLGTLLRRPFVQALLWYQVLSMFVTQLVEFLVYDRAAARYSGSTEIAEFSSVLTVAVNAVDIVFLVLAAGWMVSRLGMRVGLAANAAVVLVFVAGALAAGAASDTLSLAMFVLLCSARVADIAFTDGATRTAVNTAYQALPTDERLAVLTVIEGFAVPAAIGVTGVGLLLLDGFVDAGTTTLVVLTGVLAAVWIGSALSVYRRYQSALLDTLRRRALDPAALRVEDDATLAVLDRLVTSDDERDVRLSLEVLSEHPLLAVRLEAMMGSALPGVRAEALGRLAAHDPARARRHAQVALADPAAEVRAAAVALLAASGDADDIALAERAASSDEAPAVRLRAHAGLAAAGGDGVGARFEEALGAIVESGDVAERLAAVHATRLAPTHAVAALRRLVADPDPSVAAAACATAVETGERSLLQAVVADLDHPSRASGAAEALRGAGADLAAVADARLTTPDGLSDAALCRLVRCCRALSAEDAVAVLGKHALHPSRDVGLAVLGVLVRVAPRPDARCHTIAETVVRTDAAHAAAVLHALALVGDDPASLLLRDALRDELELVQHRVAAALSLRHDPAVLQRATEWLASGADHLAALALETLDVTLLPDERALALPVLLAGSDPARRLEELGRHVDVPQVSRDELLADLVADPHGRWRRPWLAACALHTAAVTGAPGLAALVATARASGDPVVAETAAWAAAGS